MFLKQNGVHFVHCLQQGSKIEGVVLNRVCILGILCPKQGQGFKSPSGSTTPKYWSTSPITPPSPGGALLKFSCILPHEQAIAKNSNLVLVV